VPGIFSRKHGGEFPEFLAQQKRQPIFGLPLKFIKGENG